LVLVHPTSLVFVGIVGLWAAYLLPQWIRRRDALGASRTEDRHSHALRVLARRHRERRAGPSTAPLFPGLLRTPSAPEPAPIPAAPLPIAPVSNAARRRRTVLVTLLGIAVLAVGGAVTGVVPVLAAFAAVALLAAEVAALRAVAVRDGRRRSVEALRPVQAATRPARRSAASLAAPEPVVVHAPVVPEPEVVEPPMPVVGIQRYAGTWTPIPVPPPTYTLKPMAPRPEPAPLETPAAPPAASAPRLAVLEEPADVDLDDVLERRRAVNG
jgi:hypothetical protein